METLGRHVIAELDGCDPGLLSDSRAIRRLLLDAARRAGATALADETFAFQNGGVSGFVLLAESHISIHTWPEHRYAAVDIYTCGRHTMPDKACAYLADRMGATQVRTTALDRGVPGMGGGHEQRLNTPAAGGFPRPTLAKLPRSA
jgi:S-adenosylmethionine decarboxylase